MLANPSVSTINLPDNKSGKSSSTQRASKPEHQVPAIRRGLTNTWRAIARQVGRRAGSETAPACRRCRRSLGHEVRRLAILGGVLGIPRVQRRASGVGPAGVIALASRRSGTAAAISGPPSGGWRPRRRGSLEGGGRPAGGHPAFFDGGRRARGQTHVAAGFFIRPLPQHSVHFGG